MAKYSVDANQSEIIAALEQCGCSVVSTAMMGGGFGDLLIARNGVTVMIECKSRAGKLRQSQIDFRDWWKGRYEIVRDAGQAVEVARSMV